MNPFSDLTETTIRRQDIFRGRILDVHVDEVRLPNGHTAIREVADHCPAVAVVALDEEDRVLTVSQYRYVFSRMLPEIPAGKLDDGEEPAAGALRELREETGAVPEELIPLGRILPSPGCFGEAVHLFLARGLRMGAEDPDEDEFLRVERIPFEEMVRRCVSGEIEDAKTVAAVLKVRLLREG